jgi:hypothetical protein
MPQSVWQQTSTARMMTTKEECGICLEDISHKAEARPCRHRRFDYTCLMKWLEVSDQCPLCRARITQVRYNFNCDKNRAAVFQVAHPRQRAIPIRPQEPPRRLLRRGLRGYFESEPLRDNRAQAVAFLAEAEEIRRRRRIYRRQLYSLHVGSNRRQASRYTELDSRRFILEPELCRRAKLWMRRELMVFDTRPRPIGERVPYHLEEMRQPTGEEEDVPIALLRHATLPFLLEYMMAILKTFDTQGSAGQAEEMLQEYIGRPNARLFLHELRSWLRSPYSTLEEWDQAVQYEESGRASYLDEDEERNEQDREEAARFLRRARRRTGSMTANVDWKDLSLELEIPL